jgi:hypothetical protein
MLYIIYYIFYIIYIILDIIYYIIFYTLYYILYIILKLYYILYHIVYNILYIIYYIYYIIYTYAYTNIALDHWIINFFDRVKIRSEPRVVDMYLCSSSTPERFRRSSCGRNLANQWTHKIGRLIVW